MATQSIEKQLHSLNRQMAMLRSAVISVVGDSDPEGEYRPEFIEKMFHLIHQDQRGIAFTTQADFLKRIS